MDIFFKVFKEESLFKNKKVILLYFKCLQTLELTINL